MAKKRSQSRGRKENVKSPGVVGSADGRKRLKVSDDRDTSDHKKAIKGVSKVESNMQKTIGSNKAMEKKSAVTEISLPTAVGSTQDDEKWSKSKKKRMRKVMAELRRGNTSTDEKDKSSAPDASKSKTEEAASECSLISSAIIKSKKSSTLQDGFKSRLAGSRFRILNEELYTTTSQESFDRFSRNPDLFEQYHEGFRHQVSSWPENPVDAIVRSLTATYATSGNGKKRKGPSSSIVVADFGCGDAQLAKDLANVTYGSGKRGQDDSDRVFTVHSFDLVAPNEFVTACDMANVPLENKSVDVCVFCLSLMGTNLADFVREAHRVLKDDGRVKIAEVRSRIEYSHGRKGGTMATEGTVQEFLDVLKQLGFDCISTDKSNIMFLLLELKKNGKAPNKTLEFSAKPCIYKRR